ncbi:MAG: hypothetical protein IE927_13675 [Rhodobacterales bacterium]|nr:hypothetical protein [Rhodobacterales bacterium]
MTRGSKAWRAGIALMAGLMMAGAALAQGAPPPDDTAPVPAAATAPDCKPGFGCVTRLPLPRFVSLKTDAGNARRGPGLSHRIDWVFLRAGMPLRITAEYEHWRRVEDAEGVGGWMHYSQLSGARSVQVTGAEAEFRTRPDAAAPVRFKAEPGVIGRVLECGGGWCQVQAGDQRGWVQDLALWGVAPGETID